MLLSCEPNIIQYLTEMLKMSKKNNRNSEEIKLVILILKNLLGQFTAVQILRFLSFGLIDYLWEHF
jgi:hypothetical protein